MTVNELIIQLIGSIMLISSVLVVITINPVHSILYLILVFLNAAAILIVLQVEFLALMFIIVYVGAIAVLFIFVIMALNIKIAIYNARILNYFPIGVLLLSVFGGELYYIYKQQYMLSDGYLTSSIVNTPIQYINWVEVLNSFSNIEALGFVLYTKYFDLFILSGIVLLVAMIGAITLTLYKNVFVKKQEAYQQVLRIGELNLYK